VLYGSLILLPLFMQTLLGWTAMAAGLWTSPRGIGTALLIPVVGYLLGKGWDGRWMLAIGFVVASLSLLGFSTMTLQSGTWDIFFYQICQGLGMSLVFVPLTTLTMDPIPRLETGYATSLYSVMRNVGSSLGISFVTTWLARRSQFHQTVLAAHVTPYSMQFQQMEGQLSNMLFLREGVDSSTAHDQAMALIYGSVRRQASLLSFTEAFRVIGIGFLACTALILLMRRSKHHHSGLSSAQE
jgi:DHA2 family multidrug resistance protein